MNVAIAPEKQSRKQSKRKRTPAEVAYGEIVAATKNRTPDLGWQAYQDALTLKVELSKDAINPLLYLFTGTHPLHCQA